MDRIIQQPGQVPLVEQALATQRAAMIADASLAQAVMGTGTVLDGLACTPVAGALSVSIGPGTIFSQVPLDQNAFGVLPADTTHAILKAGVNLDAVPFVFAAPTTAGQSVNVLIEAAFVEADGNPLLLPFYNAADPAHPFSGPGGGGATVNTTRSARVQLQAKAGVAAPTGSQVTPAVDAGWVPLYVISLNAGMTSVPSGAISVAPGAPFLTIKLPQLTAAAKKTSAWVDAVADHGADPTGATDTTSALLAALADAATSGKELFFPVGHYVCDEAIAADLAVCALKGLRIRGSGGQNTLLDFTNVTSGVPLQILCSTGACFYLEIEDIAIKGNVPGPVVKIGKDDFSDAFNSCRIDGVIVNNLNTTSAAVGVKMNYIVTFEGWCTVNCAGQGDALLCCQVQAATIDGSFGNATNGIHFTGGYNFGVKVLGDIEAVTTCVLIDNARSTGISFDGGQWSWSSGVGAIDAPAGSNNTVSMSVNFGNGAPYVTTRTVGVTVQNTGIGVITTGGENVAPVAGDAVVSLLAPTGFSGFWKMLTGTLQRWQFGKNNAAETGGNVGSDLILTRYNDAGVAIDNPISVNRASGRTTVSALQATLFGVGSATPVGPYTFVGSRSTTPTDAQFAQIYTALASFGIGIDDTTA